MNAVGCELSAAIQQPATWEGQPPQRGEGVICRQSDVSWGSLLDSAAQERDLIYINFSLSLSLIHLRSFSLFFFY